MPVWPGPTMGVLGPVEAVPAKKLGAPLEKRMAPVAVGNGGGRCSLPVEYRVQRFAEPDAVTYVLVPRIAGRSEVAQGDLPGLGKFSFQVGTHDHRDRKSVV